MVADEEESESKQNDRSLENEIELVVDVDVGATPLEGEDQGHTHDPHEPREDKVCHRQAVPFAVAEEPVAPAPIVHKDHDH